MLPCSFDGICINDKSNHNYNTRNNDDYQVPMHRVNNILNTGPKIRNNLPKYVKCCKSIGQLKSNIVSLLDDLKNQIIEAIVLTYFAFISLVFKLL